MNSLLKKCLCLFLLCPSVLLAQEKATHKPAKHLKPFRQCKATHLIQKSAPQETKTAYIPLVHDVLWPHFCIHHLLNDPEGCSEWDENECGQLQLTFEIQGFSEGQVDRKLLSKLGHRINYIPSIAPPKSLGCGYATCKRCLQAVKIRAEKWDEETSYLVYKCKCSDRWIDPSWLQKADIEIHRNWQFCNAPAINTNYVDWHAQTYFSFLLQYLDYLEENPTCSCYWPQLNPQARSISNSVIENLEVFDCEENAILFSPYLKECTEFGFKVGLFTHTFFYSQYHQVLSDFSIYLLKTCSYSEYVLAHLNRKELEREIQSRFLKLYNECLQKHPHPKIHYERGMALFHQGELADSLEDIRKFIAYAEENHLNAATLSNLYYQEGALLSEGLSYDEAISSLSKAIEKDPSNHEAYFERAIAYFETGSFDKSLSDYLESGFKPSKKNWEKFNNIDTYKFFGGITVGIPLGAKDSFIEFFPSLMSSFHGLSKGLWALTSNPVSTSYRMVTASYSCIEYIRENSTVEILKKLVPELRECIERWDIIDDWEKGRYVGYIIGKYGIDVFMGSGSVKALKYYRDLRRANAILTFETASLSPQFAAELRAYTLAEWEKRNAIISSKLKFDVDKQGKHIEGHRNFDSGRNRSILIHSDPERLGREYMGTGKRFLNRYPGKDTFIEIVDFGEFIGYALVEEGKIKIPTTMGKIHYSRKGFHIVPYTPKR